MAVIVRHIFKTVINLVLNFTWFNKIGIRLRYRIKQTSYECNRVGWTVTIFRSFEHPIKKRWKKITTLGWFNTTLNKEISKNISGFADPFLISYRSELYVLFELIVKDKGEIWYSKLLNGRIQAPKPALKEDFHLSYPNIFCENGEIYMIPETGEDFSVRLYKAEKFPNVWSVKKILNYGKHFVDTSFIKIDQIYYWFVYDINLNDAMLFFSYGISGEWQVHPQQEKINYRNGGQIIQYNGSLYRPVQNESTTYGSGLNLMKINELSTLTYHDEICFQNFLGKNIGYSLEGAHHLTFVEWNGDWIVATDGINRNFYRVY